VTSFVSVTGRYSDGRYSYTKVRITVSVEALKSQYNMLFVNIAPASLNPPSSLGIASIGIVTWNLFKKKFKEFQGAMGTLPKKRKYELSNPIEPVNAVRHQCRQKREPQLIVMN